MKKIQQKNLNSLNMIFYDSCSHYIYTNHKFLNMEDTPCQKYGSLDGIPIREFSLNGTSSMYVYKDKQDIDSKISEGALVRFYYTRTKI
jgi:hypothetical protein